MPVTSPPTRLRSPGVRLVLMPAVPYARGTVPEVVPAPPAANVRSRTVARGGFGLLGDRIEECDLAPGPTLP